MPLPTAIMLRRSPFALAAAAASSPTVVCPSALLPRVQRKADRLRRPLAGSPTPAHPHRRCLCTTPSSLLRLAPAVESTPSSRLPPGGAAAVPSATSGSTTGAVRATPFGGSVTIPLPGDGGITEDVTFPALFLRDACACASCVDPSTSQKNFQTSDIPPNIAASFRGFSADGTSALVAWHNDVPGTPASHTSALPLALLRRAAHGDARQRIEHYAPGQRVPWDAAGMRAVHGFTPFAQYARDDAATYAVLCKLRSHGLAFLGGVPDPTTAPGRRAGAEPEDSAAGLLRVVERIGPLRSSFYGLTWDVRSVEAARNVAYTHQYLGLHMDLCYMDLTPQFQFLHSLRARAPGGESLFADALRAAETVRREAPELFGALCEFPVTYHYYNAGQSYRQVRPTVELEDPGDLSSPIRLVNWSPPFQGPFAHDVGLKDGGKALKMYHEAAREFDRLINAPENVFELRMEEGDCVIFDNRRVLHARRAFDVTKGERWLKGAYLDRDVFSSRLARLEEVHGST